MKNLVLIVILFSITFSYAIDKKSKKGNKAINNTETSTSKDNHDVLRSLDFTADVIFKNLTFNSIDKIDFINIYNENQQQIFSANANIIVGDTLNVSFLEKGTYYIEVIIGENIGAKQIII